MTTEYSLKVVCSYCGEPVETEVDSEANPEMIDFAGDDKHDCWGDTAHLLALIGDDGISVSDERVRLKVEY